jgi:uncharacterized protein
LHTVAIEVHDSIRRSRYEITIDGRLVGFADYRRQGDTVVFPHTEIEPSMRNQGLGAVLVRGALDDLRGRGRWAVPRCWYVVQFINEHPEYADLVAKR